MAHADRQYGKLYPVARAVLRPTFTTLFKIEVSGVENVPESGPAIMCPNHVSVMDSFLLPCVLPRRITYVGKSEYLDSWKTRHLFPALGMIPIDRSGGDAAQRALDVAAQVLEAGELFGIYPEGTRSRDGVLHRGRTGAARLALRTGAPLVPVGLIGTRDIQPPGARAPRPFKACEIRIGRPIDPRHYQGRADDRLVLRQITDELMYEIRELSGQDYVDEYAGSGREDRAAAASAASAGGASPGVAPAERSGSAAAGNGARGDRRGDDVVVARQGRPRALESLVDDAPLEHARRSSADALANPG